MYDSSTLPPTPFTKSACHSESSVLEKTGCIRAAIMSAPTPRLLASGQYPNVPMLLLDADKAWDATYVLSLARVECNIGTFHVTTPEQYTLLGISLGGPDFTLAVIVDPFTPTGRHFIERWHVTGVLSVALCHENDDVAFVEVTSCTAGVSELRTMPTPESYSAYLFVPSLTLKKVHKDLQGITGSKQLILVSASDELPVW